MSGCVTSLSAIARELEARGIRMPGKPLALAACPCGAPMAVHVALLPGEPEVELAIAVTQDACFFVVECANHVHYPIAAYHNFGLKQTAAGQRGLEVAVWPALLLNTTAHSGTVDRDFNVHFV